MNLMAINADFTFDLETSLLTSDFGKGKITIKI